MLKLRETVVWVGVFLMVLSVGVISYQFAPINQPKTLSVYGVVRVNPNFNPMARPAPGVNSRIIPQFFVAEYAHYESDCVTFYNMDGDGYEKRICGVWDVTEIGTYNPEEWEGNDGSEEKEEGEGVQRRL
jgi:hypothetical protein